MNKWPYAISGVGISLGLVLLAEIVIYSLEVGEPHPGFKVGFITSLPFIIGLVFCGYWLVNSEIISDQYGRIGLWCVASGITTSLIILAIIVDVQQVSVLLIIATVRWSAAIGGGTGLVIGVFQARAVTQAVKAEQVRLRHQQIERERDHLEEFSQIISHDLRNPLNVAQGYLDLIAEEHDSPHIDKIDASHERMSEIIRDTLALARAGQTVGDTTKVDLSTIATKCWETVDQAGSTLVTEDTATIIADDDRLRHLLENLFRNAIEHSETNVTIRVGVLDSTPGFYVEDDGPGIPDSERDSVFKSGYSGTTDGTGLGLSLVNKIAEAHNWEIKMSDSTNNGARFEFTNVEIADT